MMAYMLNIPVLTAPGGNLGASAHSFASCDQENVIVEVVKKQLDGDGTVIRLYECYGARTDVTLTLDRVPESVKRVNMLEEEAGDVQAEGRQIRFTLRPYEIETFLIR